MQNQGGVKYLWLANVNDVISVDLSADGTTVKSVSLKTEQAWKKITPSINSCLMLEKPGRKGVFTKISCVLPQSSIEQRIELQKMIGGRYVVMVVTQNDEIRVLGTKRNPAVLSVNSVSTETSLKKSVKARVSWGLTTQSQAPVMKAVAQVYVDEQGRLVYDNRFTPNLQISLINGNISISGLNASKYSLQGPFLVYNSP